MSAFHPKRTLELLLCYALPKGRRLVVPRKDNTVMIYVAGALCIGNGVMFLIQSDVGLGLASVIVGAAITVQRVLLNRKRWGPKGPRPGERP